jgi:hypothetical protein
LALKLGVEYHQYALGDRKMIAVTLKMATVALGGWKLTAVALGARKLTRKYMRKYENIEIPYFAYFRYFCIFSLLEKIHLTWLLSKICKNTENMKI